MEERNVTLVRRGFEAFARGDLAALGEMFHDDATWHLAPCGVLEGGYEGRDRILGLFATIHRETDGTFATEPRTVLASGDRVFVETSVSGKRRGRTLDSGEVLVFTMADEKASDVAHDVRDFPELERFWS
ncbi:MAG: nuclear transport factor 2 family protein [Vulcanimicrobiaceae bacterium]